MAPDPTSLDRLHDVVAPPPVPWWPPAPGWYWLLGFLAIFAAYGVIRGFIRWQRNRYRREALAECRRQFELINDPKARVGALISLAEVLKRAAMTAFGRSENAPLTGRPLRAFLERTCPKQVFDAESVALLEQAAYGEVDAATVDEKRARASATVVHDWIAHHRPADRAEGGVAC